MRGSALWKARAPWPSGPRCLSEPLMGLLKHCRYPYPILESTDSDCQGMWYGYHRLFRTEICPINQLIWNTVLVGLVSCKLYRHVLVKTVWFGMVVIGKVSCPKVTGLPLFLHHWCCNLILYFLDNFWFHYIVFTSRWQQRLVILLGQLNVIPKS